MVKRHIHGRNVEAFRIFLVMPMLIKGCEMKLSGILVRLKRSGKLSPGMIAIFKQARLGTEPQ